MRSLRSKHQGIGPLDSLEAQGRFGCAQLTDRVAGLLMPPQLRHVPPDIETLLLKGISKRPGGRLVVAAVGQEYVGQARPHISYGPDAVVDAIRPRWTCAAESICNGDSR